MKAKFNVDHIINSNTIYPKDFVELVIKYEDKIIEADEEVFGGYEVELEGRTLALYDDELIIVGE